MIIEIIGACTGLVLCGWYLGAADMRRQLKKHLRKAYDQGYHDGKWCRNRAELEYMCREASR